MVITPTTDDRRRTLKRHSVRPPEYQLVVLDMSSLPLSKSLVLVIGAGASKEANLPVGAELKKQIAEILDIRYGAFSKTSGDDVIDSAFRRLAASANSSGIDMNSLLRSSRHIRDAMPQAISIDNFIDSHRADKNIALCGKLAIARCILAAESRSLLMVDRSNIYNKINFGRLENTWFNAFFQLLTENCQHTDLAARLSKVAIICFNYDRCIEHYLFSALQNYYGMKPEDAAATLLNLEIHHPYGTVGQLPWQDQREGFDFGATPSSEQLLMLAGELRTFTEGADAAKSDISAVRASLATANRIAFLGFAFHRLNIQLLFPGPADGETMRACSVYATAHGISPADIQNIQQELRDLGSISPERVSIRNDLKCAQLFRDYWRGLSLP